MQSRFLLSIAAAIAVLAGPAAAGTRGSDQLFWVPTIEQALEMARVTGRPIFVTYYTCVGKAGHDTETYTGKRTVW